MLKARPSYLQPLYLSLDGSTGSALRSQAGERRHARSRSADNRALSRSLTRTIEAARGVRAASRSVAHTLSSGLHPQGVLTQSYLRWPPEGASEHTSGSAVLLLTQGHLLWACCLHGYRKATGLSHSAVVNWENFFTKM